MYKLVSLQKLITENSSCKQPKIVTDVMLSNDNIEITLEVINAITKGYQSSSTITFASAWQQMTKPQILLSLYKFPLRNIMQQLTGIGNSEFQRDIEICFTTINYNLCITDNSPVFLAIC